MIDLPEIELVPVRPRWWPLFLDRFLKVRVAEFRMVQK